MNRSLAFAVAALSSLACQTTESVPPVPAVDSVAEPAPEPTAVALPADWAELPPRLFEEQALALLPGPPARFGESDLATLRSALAGEGAEIETAVRAAVLLSRSREPVAAEILLERLEEHVAGEERNSDAAHVVAAAGLGELTGPGAPPDLVPRLVALASGGTPHPDLEVRVECARSAVLLGSDAPLPFLISVVRIGTPKGRAEGTFWPAPLRSAWCRERAAEILAWRAGVENSYSADASIFDRDAVADRLTEVLGLAAPATR